MTTIQEELKIDSDLDRVNNQFRKYLEEVFSPIFVKKIDRNFDRTLEIKSFDKETNIMALTVGNKISVNESMFNSLPTDRAMVYVIHEFLHVLQNNTKFQEVRNINSALKNVTLKYVAPQNINKFLTGKDQNIHSDYKDEFLSYCSNFAFDWNLAPELRTEYFNILNNSGIFNMSSKWWKKRFK